MQMYKCVIAAIVAMGMLVSSNVQADYGYKDIEKSVRVATFNAFLNRSAAGELLSDLADPANPSATQAARIDQIRAVAEIIQRVRPDVLLLNEFDFDAQGTGLKLFQKNFLSKSQNGAKPIYYRYKFNQPSNTGIPSGFDLDNDGNIGGPEGSFDYADDSFGFGQFEGQFAMAMLSRYPIDYKRARTFQKFLWADMPGALLPRLNGNDWYSPEELAIVRLSSKSHWDVPVIVKGKRVHILAAHPTPPVFDGLEDRNGRRNHDEIRFWVDYVTPGRGDYIYDDKGRSGGLYKGARFVIAGDYNADPLDGDSTNGAATQLLVNLQIQDSKPTSKGGAEDAALEGAANEGQRAEAAMDTADFNPTGPGNLRVDYVLPSSNLELAKYSKYLPCDDCRGVFWPASDDPLRYLVGSGFPPVSSDHHLIWVDIIVKRGYNKY